MTRSVFPDAEIGLEIAADKAIFRNLFSPLIDNLLSSFFYANLFTYIDLYVYLCSTLFASSKYILSKRT